MNLYEQLRSFWLTCPQLSGRLELGTLPADDSACALEPDGTSEVLRRYSDGACLWKIGFRLLYRVRMGHDLQAQRDAFEQPEQVAAWAVDHLPRLDSDRRVISLELSKPAQIRAVHDESAVLAQEWALTVLEKGTEREPIFFGQALHYYGAHLYSMRDLGCEVEVETVGRSNVVLRNERGQHRLQFDLDFYGLTNAAARAEISEFEHRFHAMQPVEMEPNDGYRYRGVLLKAEELEQPWSSIIRMRFTVQAVRHGDPEAIFTNTDEYPTCISTYPRTPCRLTIPLSSISNRSSGIRVELNDQVWEIGGIINGDVVLDGLEKKLTLGGRSCAAKTVWVDFPWLKPGANHVVLKVNGTAFRCNYILEFVPEFV